MTKIEWTDKTINPLVGCSKISPGCQNCYAVEIANRFKDSVEKFQGTANKMSWTGKINIDLSVFSKIPKTPCKIFVGSMSDLFHKNVSSGDLQDIFWILSKHPNHIFQVLTKRPERMLDIPVFSQTHNIWMGVTTENQQMLDKRLPLLMRSQFPVKFLSVEPMLEPITLKEHNHLPDWVIIGGESGRKARSFHLEWGIELVEECKSLDIPVFFKQAGSKPFHKGDRIKLTEKGADLLELPECLRIRDFPSH